MTVSPVAPALPPELREALRKAQQPPGWIAPELARLRAEWEAERGPAELTPAALGETRLARAAYRAHNTWCWAKEQLRILGEMAKDRASDRSQGGRLSIGWLAGEVERIRAGVELLPDGLLVEPLAEREPAPEALRAAVDAALSIGDSEAESVYPLGLGEARVFAELFLKPRVLRALARFRWDSAQRERELREVLEDVQRAFEGALSELRRLGIVLDDDTEGMKLRRRVAAALAHPPSADAAALAKLAALPGRLREQARAVEEAPENAQRPTLRREYIGGLESGNNQYEAALRAAGLEPAP